MKSSAQSSEVGTLSLVPMNPDEAKMIVRRLMGSYPSQKLADPEIYLAELVTLLCGYPRWAGERGSATARDKSPTFIPTVPEVKRELEDQVKSLRYAAQWKRDAQETQKRLSGPDFSDSAYRDRMREKLEGLASDLRSRGQKPRKTLSEIRDELIAQIGQEAFDAIPAAPPRGQTVSEAAIEVLKRQGKSRVQAA